jgi:hypothetical protein
MTAMDMGGTPGRNGLELSYKKGSNRILLCAGSSGYHLDVPYQLGSYEEQEVLAYDRLKDPSELAKRMADLNITHMIVNREHLAERNRAAELMTSTLAQRGELIIEDTPFAR